MWTVIQQETPKMASSVEKIVRHTFRVFFLLQKLSEIHSETLQLYLHDEEYIYVPIYEHVNRFAEEIFDWLTSYSHLSKEARK